GSLVAAVAVAVGLAAPLAVAGAAELPRVSTNAAPPPASSNKPSTAAIAKPPLPLLGALAAWHDGNPGGCDCAMPAIDGPEEEGPVVGVCQAAVPGIGVVCGTGVPAIIA